MSTLLNMNLYIFLAIILTNFIICITSDDEVYRWDPDLYPNLTSPKQAKFCTGANRNPPSSVCDPDQILKKNQAQLLDELINKENNDTKCYCDKCPPHKRGLNIKVALVNFIKVIRNVSLDQTVEMFAERTRRKWRFGEDCSNDILIFCAALDNKIYIAMGSRARSVLSEDTIEKILIETKVHFISAYYQQGLESIIASLQDMSEQFEPKASRLSIGTIILIVVCVIVIVFLLLGIGFWCFVKKDRNSLNVSLSGSKSKTQTKPRIPVSPIYSPVKTSDTPTDDSTLKIGSN